MNPTRMQRRWPLLAILWVLASKEIIEAYCSGKGEEEFMKVVEKHFRLAKGAYPNEKRGCGTKPEYRKGRKEEEG
ncbi:MAG: hypothetical protein AB1744_10575, partial [Candidatus Zixiibacteriota bacterium]